MGKSTKRKGIVIVSRGPAEALVEMLPPAALWKTGTRPDGTLKQVIWAQSAADLKATSLELGGAVGTREEQKAAIRRAIPAKKSGRRRISTADKKAFVQRYLAVGQHSEPDRKKFERFRRELRFGK